MKNKLFTVVLIGVLVFSTLGVALAEQVKCPECHGTGETTCPTCDGTGQIASGDNAACPTCDGTGEVGAKLKMVSMDPYVDEENDQTVVNAVYRNQEDIDVTATITASIQDHSGTSEETTFPPGEDVPVTVTIDFVGTYSMLQLVQSIQMSVDSTTMVTCPDCGGTGISAQAVCPDCHGDGTIACPDCKGSGYVEAGFLTGPLGSGLSPTVIGGAGAGVAIALVAVASVVVMKKRRVSEKSLRRKSSGEFQQWVLKKLDGTPATSKDIAMGIDGYSRLHEPIAIKQTDNVGLAVIDSFAASLARNRARSGTIVAFGFSDDAVRGKIRARTTYRLNLELMTVQDIINRR
ncbi:MAG: hypothetical protein ACQCN6_11055 [Candidatus Bathyarchaeia archaeon]|jgi:hypothetical protein